MLIVMTYYTMVAEDDLTAIAFTPTMIFAPLNFNKRHALVWNYSNVMLLNQIINSLINLTIIIVVVSARGWSAFNNDTSSRVIQISSLQ